jgi:guanylate kinase
LFVIVGTSGSGKSVLNDKIAVHLPELKRIISCTTRAPRPGEIDGVHYRFFSAQQFLEKMGRGEFVEDDQPFKNDIGSPNQHDRYGRLRQDFALLERHHCYADMTEAGVLELQKLGLDQAIYIRLQPSNKTLTERDSARAQGDAERAQLPIRYDYMIENDHSLPNKGGLERAFCEFETIANQCTHPEG